MSTAPYKRIGASNEVPHLWDCCCCLWDDPAVHEFKQFVPFTFLVINTETIVKHYLNYVALARRTEWESVWDRYWLQFEWARVYSQQSVLRWLWHWRYRHQRHSDDEWVPVPGVFYRKPFALILNHFENKINYNKWYQISQTSRKLTLPERRISRNSRALETFNTKISCNKVSFTLWLDAPGVASPTL